MSIVEEVERARAELRHRDRHAYGGYVTDAACCMVARHHGMKATDVLRAYRREHPSPRPGQFTRPLPRASERPDAAVVEEVRALLYGSEAADRG